MRTENQKMKTFLASHGIKATPKYIAHGSMRGTWRISSPDNLRVMKSGKANWFGNTELQNKMNEIGFRDFDNKPLNDFSGNGGLFSIFALAPFHLRDTFFN